MWKHEIVIKSQSAAVAKIKTMGKKKKKSSESRFLHIQMNQNALFN